MGTSLIVCQWLLAKVARYGIIRFAICFANRHAAGGCPATTNVQYWHYRQQEAHKCHHLIIFRYTLNNEENANRQPE